jgi:hypothetical protein
MVSCPSLPVVNLALAPSSYSHEDALGGALFGRLNNEVDKGFGNPGLPFMAIRGMSCTVKSVKDDGFPEILCFFFDRPGAIVSFGENLRRDLGACPGAHAFVSVNPWRCLCGFLLSGEIHNAGTSSKDASTVRQENLNLRVP